MWKLAAVNYNAVGDLGCLTQERAEDNSYAMVTFISVEINGLHYGCYS